MNRYQKQIKNDAKAFRALRGKEKLHFLWDYYKLPICAVAIVLALIGSTLLYSAGRGKVNLYVMLINANDETESTWFRDTLAQRNFDMEKYGVDVEDHYTLNPDNAGEADIATMQVLAALFGVGDMDLFVANQEVFDLYTAQDGFENLGVLLPRELKEGHSGDLYRYTNSDGAEIIGGVWLREGSALHQAGYYSGDVLVGIATQAEYLDEALAVVEALLESNPQQNNGK